MRVRKNRVAARAEEVHVPDTDERHQDRRIARHLGLGEMQVDLARSGEKLVERIGSDGAQGAEAGRGPDRVSPADGFGDRQHVGRAERGRCRRVACDRDEMLPRIARAEPESRRACVRERFLGRERLRHHDEERRIGLRAGERALQVQRIHVRHKAKFDRRIAYAERIDDELRPERRAAGAEVNDPADASSGAHSRRQLAHALERRFHAGRRRIARALRYMLHRAFLGRIDRIAPEKSRAPFVESPLPCELEQRLEHGTVDPLAREVVSHARRVDAEAVLARRIAREEIRDPQ